MNEILAKRLFKVQDAQELNDPEKVSSRWGKHLYGLVNELNDTTTEMIGMKPKDAIVLDEVPLVEREAYPPEDKLPEDGLYHYLLQPSEEHDHQRHRDTEQLIGCGLRNLQIERSRGKPRQSRDGLPVRWTRESICVRRVDVNS